jgi:lipid II:glycine glycyltransferase (peptidoglycan interpeptide bridge formation enzyme)
VYRFIELTKPEFASFAQFHSLANWNQNLAAQSFREAQGYRTYLVGVKANYTAAPSATPIRATFANSNINTINDSELTCNYRSLDDSDPLLAAGLIQVRNGNGLIIQGPLLDFSDRGLTNYFFQQLIDFCNGLRLSSIDVFPPLVQRTLTAKGDITQQFWDLDELLSLLSPLEPVSDPLGLDPRLPRFNFIKDLSKLTDCNQLLASFRQTTRQSVRKTLNDHYAIRALGLDELSLLQSLLDDSNTKNHIQGRDLDYLRRLFLSYSNDIDFLLVEHDQTPISGAIFVKEFRQLIYFLSGTATPYRSLMGAHHLQFKMMERCLTNGVMRYNMLGVEGRFDHNPLLDFKAGFRGYLEEGVGCWRKIIHKNRYVWHKLKNRLW